MKKIALILLALCSVQLMFAEEMILQDISFRAGDLTAKIIDNWMLQPSWGGEISRSNGVMTLKPTDTGNRVWGRAMSPLRNCNPSGMKMTLTCRVKGSGQFVIGAIRYKPGQKGPQKDDFTWSTPVALTDEYQDLTLELDYTGAVLRNVNLVMELKGEGEAQVDWTRLTGEMDKTAEIQRPDGVFVQEGKPVPDIRFQTNRPNGKFFYYIQKPVTEMIDPGKELTADADGVVVVPGAELPAQPSSYEVLLGVAGNGMPRVTVAGSCRRCRFAMNQDNYFGVASVVQLSAAEWEENLAAAKAVNPEGKRNILVLADSIWDFDRGGNVADRLGFFLRAAHDGSFKIANYAVHGDNVHRMMCRFVGRFKEVAHGQDRYKTIREENPEMILFMLGHNDIAASSRDNFEKPGIAFDLQRSSMDALVAALKKQWPAAKIVFLTPLSADTKTIRARVAARLKEKNPGVVFRYGDDDKVAEYRKILESVAQKYQIPVWDIYAPMENLENKPSYFYPDSVHLSPKGHALLAKLLLKEMAK